MIPVRNDRDIFLRKELEVWKMFVPLRCISYIVHYNK